jgi:hypothetical protein
MEPECNTNVLLPNMCDQRQEISMCMLACAQTMFDRHTQALSNTRKQKSNLSQDSINDRKLLQKSIESRPSCAKIGYKKTCYKTI